MFESLARTRCEVYRRRRRVAAASAAVLAAAAAAAAAIGLCARKTLSLTQQAHSSRYARGRRRAWWWLFGVGDIHIHSRPMSCQVQTRQ